MSKKLLPWVLFGVLVASACAPDPAPTEVGSDDFDAPEIVSIDAPTQVAVGETLTISAHITDATGVASMSIYASLDGTIQSMAGCSGYPTLTSGTPSDGIWTFACPIVEPFNSGTYTFSVTAADNLGNRTPWNAPGSTGTFTIVR